MLLNGALRECLSALIASFIVGGLHHSWSGGRSVCGSGSYFLALVIFSVVCAWRGYKGGYTNRKMAIRDALCIAGFVLVAWFGSAIESASSTLLTFALYFTLMMCIVRALSHENNRMNLAVEVIGAAVFVALLVTTPYDALFV